jgi:hydroxymethylglutaryl-CoA lyase
LPEFVEIVEVSARDGIQNEPKILGLNQRVRLIERAREAGLCRFEVGSFVSATRVPQMASTDQLVRDLPAELRADAIGLVLSKVGFERACAAGCSEVNFVIVLSDTFSLRNQGRDTAACVALWREIYSAMPAGMRSCVTFAAAFGCPFEGEVTRARLEAVLNEIGDAVPDELSLADTIGVAVPRDICDRIKAVQAFAPDKPLRLHLHNTRNTGCANVFAGLEQGVSIFEASLGGVGGCPFAPRATGNIATEDLVYMLERSGISTGVDLDRAIKAAEWLEGALNIQAPGLVLRAGGFPALERVAT